MSHHRIPDRVIGLVLVAASVVACSAPDRPEPDRFLISTPGEAQVDPAARIPNSSRLLLLDASHPESPPQSVAPSLDSAGAPAVSWDGRRLVFAARSEASEPLSLWIADLDEAGLERLETGKRECGSADFLPDGRVVFSARTEGEPPIPELRSTWALFVLEPESGDVQRISYGLSEIDPAVLPDGRVLYSQWQPPGDGRGPEGAFSLFTIHPDGTGISAWHGFHGGPTWKLRARPIAGGDVLFRQGEDLEALRDWRVDRRAPSSPPSRVLSSGALEAATFGRGRGNSILALGKEGLFELETNGPPRLLRSGVQGGEVLSAHRRPRPQGHLSMVDPTLSSGQIFGVDARPADRPDASVLRFRSVASPGAEATQLGLVDLAEDGSFFVEVPANRPLWLDVLSSGGEEILGSSTPLWVRPNEKRGCVGCHEPPTAAPPNRRPLAVLGPPVDLTGSAG